MPQVAAAALVVARHTIHDHLVLRRGPTVGGLWPETMAAGQAVVDARRRADGGPPTLWSTYAGLLEARNGLFNPSGFDYAFHALGPENRRKYVADFERARPTIVQTMTPMYIMSEVWMVQTSWEFYDVLLQHYRLAGATPWSTLWERIPTPKPPPRLISMLVVPPHATSVTLPVGRDSASPATPQLLEVELRYRVRNRLSFLPVLGTSPRYFVTIGNATSRFPVTLDPYTTVAHFPIVVESAEHPTLAFHTYALFGGASFDVSGVRIFAVPVDETNAAWVMNLRDAERQRLPKGPANDTTGRYAWR